MKIKKIISQNRRDFTAIYVCESCNHECEGYGYDDAHFHQTVIPKMTCDACKKGADENYQPRTTKYSEGTVV